jgi:murein DD-endopeptidase MepM/ murein hydrolase activator NlpD
MTENLFNFTRISLSVIALVSYVVRALCKSEQASSSLHLPYAIVQQGDTVATVAQRYHLSPEQVIQYNGIKPPYKIYVGQPLKVIASLIPKESNQVHRKKLKQKVSQNQTKAEKIIQIKNTDPMSSGVSSQDLKLLKKPQQRNVLLKERELPKPELNLNSQVLILPSRKPNLPKNSKFLTHSSEIQKGKQIRRPLVNFNSQRRQNFLWPLKGKILSGFGTKSNLKYNRGINISAALGDCVVACERGIVAYAGNEIKGFGNMILIKHANGWMSAYAHNLYLLVKRGDHVCRGQKIAEAGATGNVEQPQLHFELRQKTRAVDPQKYLGY